jgi:hypothetical protein
MIIGLSGYARTGKDTIADILVEKYAFTKVAFATPIREALTRLNPNIMVGYENMPLSVALKMYDWEQLKKEAPEIRGLLQRLGTEVGREMFDEDFWVSRAFAPLDLDEDIVFTDVRFKNEADTIKSYGGSIWRIVRSDIEAINKHSSETELDDYDFDTLIRNDFDLEMLTNLVDMGVNMSVGYTDV